MQPDQSSGVACWRCSGTSSSQTMSLIAARPPSRRTRKTSEKSWRRSSGRTRLSTQLETTQSTDSFGIIGRSRRNRCSTCRRSSQSWGAVDREPMRLPSKQLQVQGEVLDQPVAELDVGEANSPGDGLTVTASQGDHVTIAVHADDVPSRTDDLGEDIADLAAARSQVQHRLAFAHVGRGVAAAVIPMEDFFRDRLKVLAPVLNGATKRRFLCLCGGRVPCRY